MTQNKIIIYMYIHAVNRTRFSPEQHVPRATTERTVARSVGARTTRGATRSPASVCVYPATMATNASKVRILYETSFNLIKQLS